MVKFFIVLVLIVIILFIFRNSRKNKDQFKSDIFKKLILLIIVFGIIFFIATSGKMILPQLFNILKLALPFLTKFIGI